MKPYAHKVKVAKDILTSLNSVVVALSGGVDSSLLLSLATQTLGPQKVLAVTGKGSLISENDLNYAQAVVKQVRAAYRQIDFNPLDLPEFALNKPNRCYLCRKKLYGELELIRVEKGFAAIVDGTIADDAEDYRPGNQAAEEFNVHRPLAKAKLIKEEVRSISRDLGLLSAERPASPCLATRFPYYEEITLGGLQKVSRAETALHDQGFPIVRVRHHDGGRLARIEVPAEEIFRLNEEPARSIITEALRNLGYLYVCVDLLGFRSGSLNDVLVETLKKKTCK